MLHILHRFRLRLWGLLAQLRYCGGAHYLAGAPSLPPPLTPEQEKALLARMAQGDAAARDDLITHNLRLVVYLAKKYENSGVPAEDMISIGTIGLIKAVESFDYTKKVRFSTYAARCIENEMRMHLRHIRRSPAALSMQEPIEAARDGSALTVMDVIPDDFVLDEHFEQQDEGRRLRRLVDTLTARERQVILLRYGLGGQPPLTQQQAAALLGISRSYVSRIEKRALELLRRQVEQE